MKIGILQTGRSPDEMRDKHGDYDDLFKRMLAGRGFVFETFAALDGALPSSVNDAEGWLITGSKFSAYEELSWIRDLEIFLQEVYAAGVPIIGVCFGHQVLAKALGGKVEKFSKGWSVGPNEYQDLDGNIECLNAWHQDQVTVLPADATVIGTSDFCENAMLAYGDKALTIQAHPEFTADFLADLIDARRTVVPQSIAKLAQERNDASPALANFADRFEAFFKRGIPETNELLNTKVTR